MPVGIGASYTSFPNAIVITTRIAPTTMACSTRAERYAPPGRGVPRRRFRMPASRLNTVLIAMFV